MKSFYLVSVLSFLVLCEAQNNTINEYCEMECKDVCVPCQEPVRCGEEETDCGLGPPDPTFGGVCPPHSICVPKDMNCKFLELSKYVSFHDQIRYQMLK